MTGRVLRVVAVVAVIAPLLSFGAPALGQEDQQGDAETNQLPELSLRELLPDSQLFQPDIMDQVGIDLRPVRGLVVDLTQAYVDRDGAEIRRVEGFQERAERLSDRWAHRVVVAERRLILDTAVLAEAEAVSNLGAYGVSTFLGTAKLDLEKFSFDGVSSPVPELADSAEEVLSDRLSSARVALGASRLGLADAERTAAQIDKAVAAADSRISLARTELADANSRIDTLVPRFEQQLAAQTVADTDIPLVVLDAYFTAQVATAERRPGCRVTWSQLAGIGLIETRHGSFGGSVVGPDGQTSKKILGPVLDGTEFASIRDTDGGALDGNTEWDRAVGPMQFIPSSWQIYGQDGNGDGVRDPHNIYDAALSAAEHLCRSRGGLDADENFRVALLGYNRSDQYGLDVMAARARYAGAVRLTPSSHNPTSHNLEADPAERGDGASAAAAHG